MRRLHGPVDDPVAFGEWRDRNAHIAADAYEQQFGEVLEAPDEIYYPEVSEPC